MVRAVVVILAVIGLTWSDANAHEFWLSPQQYAVPPGAPIVADIRIGHEFKGSPYDRRAGHFQRLELIAGGNGAAIPGTDGQRPAVQAKGQGPGLVTLVYVSHPDVTTYHTWQRFEAFVQQKDAAWVLDRHRANGWRERRFHESYTRFAKSLVAVGDGNGADRAIGLEIEIVAEMNPYTDDLSAGLPVTVLHRGAPRADAQVEVFAKDAAGAVTVTTLRTDANGRTTVPVQPATEYLLDSVVLQEAAPGNGFNALWHSDWASLTFRTP